MCCLVWTMRWEWPISLSFRAPHWSGLLSGSHAFFTMQRKFKTKQKSLPLETKYILKMEVFVLIRIPSLEKCNTQRQNFSGTVPSVFLISSSHCSFMLRSVLFLIYIVGNCEWVTSDRWAAHNYRVVLIFNLLFILSWNASCSNFWNQSCFCLASLTCKFKHY